MTTRHRVFWQRTAAFLLYLFFVILVWRGSFSRSAVALLDRACETNMASMALVTELKVAAAAGSSSHIPFIGGMAREANELMQSGLHYLTSVNLVLLAESVLLRFIDTRLFAWLCAITLALTLLPAMRLRAQLVLSLLLALNPGLPLYLTAVEYVAKEIRVDLGDGLHQQLGTAHASYVEKARSRAEEQQSKSASHQKEADVPHKGGFFHDVAHDVEKVGHVAEDAGRAVADIGHGVAHIVDIGRDIVHDIKDVADKLLGWTLHLMSTVLILFVLVPLGYLYMLRLVVERLLVSDSAAATDLYRNAEQLLAAGDAAKADAKRAATTLKAPLEDKLTRIRLAVLATCVIVLALGFDACHSVRHATAAKRASVSAPTPQPTSAALTPTPAKSATPTSTTRHAADTPVASESTRTDGIDGIDVSNWQGKVDWRKVKDAGITFAFVKAAQGESFGDTDFARDWKRMKERGIIRGAYDYYVVGEDPEKEAKDFIRRVKLERGDLPPVVDIETMGESQEDNSQLAGQLRRYLDELEHEYHVKPIIYSGAYFAEQHLGGDFGDYPLWLADYSETPTVPKGWKQWTFWQYSQSGKVDGVDGDVDRDRFYGSGEQLEHLLLEKRRW